MVLAALVWLYASFVTLAYGVALLYALRRTWSLADEMPAIPVVMVTGLAVVGVLAMALSLLGGVGALANLAMLGGAVLAHRRFRVETSALLGAGWARWRLASRTVKAIAVGSVAIVLERSTATPSVLDSGLYHAQAIRWIEQYGVVPGLGNLHARFAIDSAAFALEALLGFSFLGCAPLHALNGWLGLCLVSVLLIGVDDLPSGKCGEASVAKGILLACFLPLFAGPISSPAPDVTVALVLWLALLLAADVAETRGAFGAGTPAIALAVLSTFAYAIKPSAAPAGLLAVAVLGATWRANRRGAALLAVLLAAILAPCVSRQLLLSGYPFFPFAYLDPFHFDWQVPRSVAAELTGWILSWARAPGRPPSEVMRLWPTEWLPAWFSRLGNVERFLLLAIPACAVILGVRCAVHGRARIRSSAGRWLDATLVAGVLFWFLVVPDPRFGVGFYAVLAAVLLARVARPVLPRVPSRAIAFALAALLAAEVVVFYARHPVPLAGLARRVTVPAGYPIVPTVDAKGANFTISIPERGDRCWYDPFPCVPHAPGERVERRGDDWARGFRATENGRSPQDSW